MFRTFLPLIFIFLGLSACATLDPEHATPVQRLTLEQLDQELDELEESLFSRFDEVCRTREGTIRRQLANSRKRVKQSEKKLEAARSQCASNASTEKLFLGEVENVELLDQQTTLEARIDTGAETSSLGIYQLTKFERDGNDWVKFTLSRDADADVFEHPIHDRVRIKQRDQDRVEARFEIKLDIKLGDKEYRNQLFNLSNRSHLEYQVLIGRSFLRDIAVVDVSTKHQLKRP